ncbi:MAG: T9SS type A sorting domain-containing protein [Mariniphaga sp.]
MQKYIGIILLLFFGAGVYAQNNIKSWEYWFNSDYASVVNEDVAGIQKLDVNEMIDVSTLGDGMHTVSFRFKDARGIWGPPQTRFFIKYPWTGASATQLISEYEYRMDDSNGDAVGGDETTGFTHIALETPVSPAEIALTIDLREHPKGDYYIHFRAKDTRGLWGSLVTKSMTKEAFPVAAFSTFTATHCVNSAVQFVNESIDADTWLWDFGDGTTSADFEPEHVFPGAGDYEVSLTATDSESGIEDIIIQTITINPAYETEESVEICEGDVYTWNGLDYAETGSYNEVLTSVNGCDSVVTLNLQVNPVYDVMYSGDDAIPDYLVNETFEEIPLNTFPDDWVIRYAGTGADDHFVVDDPVKNGVHALKVSGSGWAANLSKPVENIPDNVVLEGWMRAEDVASSDRNGLGIGNPNVGSWGAYWGRVEFYNGNLITFNYTGNAGGYGTQYVLQPASPNTWYHVKIEADAAAGTYKVYIDGQQASSATGGSTTTEFPLLTSISATSAELYGNGMIYFDDIRMYEGGAHPVVICESETPYIFGNQELTESGTYTETFQTIHGCDSVVTLNLIVNPTYNHTDEQTICEGETYVFGTQNLTTSGEYTEVFESVDGCDSTVVLTLTVNPVYNHTDEQTICKGETYVFGTRNLTTPGEYTHTFNSVNGCDSVVTLTLTVKPVYNETVEVTIHEDELPYIFGGESLDESGVYTKTFASVAGCDSIVTLSLTVLEYSVPVAVCNPVTIYLNETGNYSLSRADMENIAAGSSDAHTAFADLILSVTPDAFTCADAGNDVDVMVIVTNEDNYSDTCYTTVSVEDNIAPQVDCHDLEVYLGEKGEAFIDVNKIYSDAYDACGIKNIKTSREVFTCDDLGYNYFSVSVTDFNQNKTSCLNILAVFDTIRPVFGTVDDIEVAAPEGECKTTIDYPEIPAGDNCGVENLFLYEGLGPDGEFPVGTTTERWVAVDASGNSDTLTFEVKISDTPSAPGLDVIPDVEVEEDADWVTVTVTGISDGSECEEYPLGFIFSAENDQLIASYQTEYVTGEEVAYLKLLPSPDATGESNATLTVTNSETGQETGIDFILRITPVNDPPYLVHPVQDLEMKAGDSLEVVFNPEKGFIFDDVDEDDILQLSVQPEDGTTLPEWLVFRNDSLLAFPAAADTGCIELLLVATDVAGEKVDSPFMLCVDFSVGTNLLAEQEIKIYPNPTTGKVYIELSGLANRRADVSVVNILGQKVLHKTYQSEGRWEIDLSNQVSGMYLLKIRGNGIDVNRKIVLNREE